MILLTVPGAFAVLIGLLALATHLEGQHTRVTVRMTVRSRRSTPEQAEALVAAELAPVLAAYGMSR